MSRRYFFYLSDGGFEPDELGTELADDAAAQREAVRFAGEVLRGEPQRLADGAMRVEVHDETRAVRFVVVVTLEHVADRHGSPPSSHGLTRY